METKHTMAPRWSIGCRSAFFDQSFAIAMLRPMAELRKEHLMRRQAENAAHQVGHFRQWRRFVVRRVYEKLSKANQIHFHDFKFSTRMPYIHSLVACHTSICTSAVRGALWATKPILGQGRGRHWYHYYYYQYY